MMQNAFQERARGRTALTFLKSVPQKNVLETSVHPDLAYLEIFAPRADALHLLHPSLIGPDTLKRLMSSAPVTDSHCGTLDKIEKPRDNSYKISGRTTPCDSRPSTDCIILSYVGRQAERIPFTLAFPIVRHSEWNADFVDTLIPGTGPYEIEAWAFDISGVRLYKLAGQLSFP